MTEDVFLSKLASLSRLLTRLESRKDLSAEQILADQDQQDIILLNLERAIQTCVDLATMATTKHCKTVGGSSAESFALLAQHGLLDSELAQRMRKAVGFRNLAVHEYTRIDFAIVSSILKHGLQDFRDFAKAVKNL